MNRASLIRDALLPTGLFMEGTEQFSDTLPTNTYYGFNVTKTEREPVDQIHAFIAAKRIQDRNASSGPKGLFYAFVAGLFEALNTRSKDELDALIETNRAKERVKKALFESIMATFRIEGVVPLTHDLWNNGAYWEIFGQLVDSGRFSRKTLLRDTLKWYESETELPQYLTVADVAPGLMQIPQRLMRSIGDWPAPLMYTPLEVAEAMFFSRERSVTCKIGHMEETVYDKYVTPFMDVVHLRQPADLKSTRTKPRTVTPYIDKARRDPKIRIFFDDSEQTIAERVQALPVDEYVFALCGDAGEILNPILDKLVLAVEAGVCRGLPSVQVAGQRVTSGSYLIHAVATGDVAIRDLRSDFERVVYENLVAPFGPSTVSMQMLAHGARD